MGEKGDTRDSPSGSLLEPVPVFFLQFPSFKWLQPHEDAVASMKQQFHESPKDPSQFLTSRVCLSYVCSREFLLLVVFFPNNCPSPSLWQGLIKLMPFQEQQDKLG